MKTVASSDPQRAPEGAPAVELAARLRGIRKSFYGSPAVRGVDFDLRDGEVHALLGENGAGKSTLCSVLAGLYRADAGTVEVRGELRDFHSPHDALGAGVGMVYQHYRLVEALSVAENLALGRADVPRRVSRRALEERASALAAEHGMTVDPRARVGDLSVGQQQRVEILKLLGRGVRVLILDEPTAVLTPQEAERLFETTRALAAAGTSVVLVTHKLGEIISVSERVSVLCDGQHTGTMQTVDANPRTLAQLMMEREGGSSSPRPATSTVQSRDGRPVDRVCAQPAALAVSGLAVDGHRPLTDIDLDVRRGEIVGVAGVSGNGQRELADAIAGLCRPSAGSIRLGGEAVTTASVRERCAKGLGYVPEDRLGRGVAPGLTLDENLMLRHYWQRRFRRGPFLARGALRRWVAARRERVEIRGARRGLRVSILSGGNVQRAILARELDEETVALVACSPTRGLDVRVAATVRNLLRGQSEAGVGILLISEDLEELLELSSRIMVMYEGRIVGETSAEEADAEELGLMMAGAGGDRG